MADAADCKTNVGDVHVEKRIIGSTNIAVSVVGLGTVKFGRNVGVKYPTAFELPSDEACLNLLALAKSHGINLLDTAPAYGNSEARLGGFLKGERQDWVISTKVGEQFLAGESCFDFSEKAILVSIENSLRQLQTDYLDVVFVHSNGDDEKLIHEGVFEGLEKAKIAGKIRAFGMSTKTIAGGKLAVDLSDVVMVSFNPTYTDEREVITYAHDKQKGIFIKKALSSGHLPADTSPAHTLSTILHEPGVTTTIIGTLNPKHLIENISF